MRTTAIALLFGTLGLAACNTGNDLGFTPSALTAPYVLQTANGAALPAVVFDSASPPLKLEAVAGVITIKPNNVFSDVTTFRQTLGGVVSARTVSCIGTYNAVGNVFEFVETGPLPDCSRTFTGVLSGTTLTASVLGAPAVFSQ